MTESEAIKICNTIGFATSFSNPKGVPLNTTKEELTEAMRMSIQALEKQIPKKPIIKQGKYCNAYHCPVCNGYIRSINTRIEVILDENIFCGVCGQKLDWSDD